jgi:Sec-independent protein secretion pathway component TatC
MKMSMNERSASLDVRSKVSTLWVLVLFNIVFADVVGFMNPGALEGIMSGANGFEITQGLLLVFAILLEIPIAMIFLSRLLNRKANQWANTVAAVVTILFVTAGGSGYLS